MNNLKHQEVLTLVNEKFGLDDIIRTADDASKIVKPAYDAYQKNNSTSPNSASDNIERHINNLKSSIPTSEYGTIKDINEIIKTTELDGESLLKLTRAVATIANKTGITSSSQIQFTLSMFKSGRLLAVIDYLKTQPQEVQLEFYKNFKSLSSEAGLNFSPHLNQLYKDELNLVVTNSMLDSVKDIPTIVPEPVSISEPPVLPTPSVPVEDIEDKVEIIKSKGLFSFLPDSLQEKINDLLDSLNNSTAIGVIITLLVMSPIIYFVFFRSTASKVKARYGIDVNELNMLYNMYFNFWKTNKVKVQLYDNNYNKYKEDMYEQYVSFHYLVQRLNIQFKKSLLNDIRSGAFLIEFCPVKNYEFFRVPEREIDETIYTLFASTVKLNKRDFYSLLNF